MDSSIANHLGASIVLLIIFAVLFVSGIWIGIGYFVGNNEYNKGYLQGQLDYKNGIILIKSDTTTTYHLKQK